jgi:hypothetical protein
MEQICGFAEKNKAGVELEIRVIGDIKNKKYSTIHKYEPNNGDYDAFIDEINEGIEIKNDLEAEFTDNICIEYTQDSRLSGISITKSKYWIQYDQHYLYLAFTDEIKRLIRSYLVYHRDFTKFSKKLGASDYTSEECDIHLDEFRRTSKEKYGKMYDDIKSEKSIIDIPNKKLNQGTYYKYMGLYLIPKKLFSKYCLEVAHINEMTYKKLV